MPHHEHDNKQNSALQGLNQNLFVLHACGAATPRNVDTSELMHVAVLQTCV